MIKDDATSNKQKITGVVVMGDSLSDRGKLAKEKVGGVIPMSFILSFSAYLHDGRFTNGYTWVDNLAAMIATDSVIQQYKQNGVTSNADIADAVISQNKKSYAYQLSDELYVRYNNKLFLRSFCEGGLTAGDYSKDHTFNLKQEATRQMVSSLSDMRAELLENDREKSISAQTKKSIVVLELTGANDLITVNSKPSIDIADKAIAARIENIKVLYQNGYRHFALMALPDLSITPRYQRRSAQEQADIKQITNYFNTRLRTELYKLHKQCPELDANLFDMNPFLNEMVVNPAKYGFDPAKASIPFVESADYKKHQSGPMPAKDHIFFDDIHPSADTHAQLAVKVYDFLNKRYEMSTPSNNRFRLFNQPKPIDQRDHGVASRPTP